MGQHRTNKIHHRKKAAMATSFGSLRESTSHKTRSSHRSDTATTEKTEKFHSRDIRSAEAVLQRTTESPRPAAYGNRRFPNEGRAPRRESSQACGLRPAASGW